MMPSALSTIKTLGRQVKQYKKPSLLTPLFVTLEVVMEVLIPYVTAAIIDRGITAGDISQVLFYGAIMVALALMSLLFGVLAGKFAATASTGFAANLRDAMFANIQTFSFSNIDKFSTAGLVTRMTTDVTNVQNAYQMCTRIAVRHVHVLLHQRPNFRGLPWGAGAAGPGPCPAHQPGIKDFQAGF